MQKCPALIVALLLLASPAWAQRLSGTAVPEHYTLWFAPDLTSATFRGRESIRLQMRAPSRAITLHAAEIEFDEVTVESVGGLQTAQVTLDSTAETVTFTTAQEIPTGLATIHIRYRGLLNDKLRGFYLSKANGRSYAVTQLEATDARRAFPSFDEPVYKATFDVSLMIDSADTAISNGTQLSDTPGPEPGKHTLTFATTAKMSSYLVAMVVGDFVCRSGSASGTPIRVCSTPDKLPLTTYALDAAQQQLAFFNDYFGITYPFGKLDIIAVPDFAAGAMENVGAIIFRERSLLIDPASASVNAQRGVASIISHEIAHQWFGNLVTMKWWNDIWLNEGFATWIASRPIARWRPDWRVELDDAADTQSALGIDALRSTRAIRIDVSTPDQINEVFDGIAYEKTAGVLRMIEAYVGVEAFRKGIASYLNTYAFSNAAGEDFWGEMTRVTGRPIDRIMRGFVEQPGTPVVAVQTQCAAGRAETTIAQRRFVGIPGAPPDERVWTIPVCFKAGSGRANCEVLDQPQRTIPAQACGTTAFANAASQGYYFTEYSPDAVRDLGRNASRLAPIERLGLLGDEWWMVRAGRHDIGVYLDLAGSLARDETAAITDTLATRLGFVGEYLVTPDQQSRWQTWIRSRFRPVLDTLGIPGTARDPAERQTRRAELLGLVASGDPVLQRRVRELAERYLADPTSLSGTLAPVVLRVAAASGDVALYDRYFSKLAALTAKPEDYYRFFNALPAFGQPELVQRTLTFALSPDVRTQDTASLLAGLMARPASREATWTFIKTQWPALTQKLGTFQGIPTIVGSVGGFCSAERAADVRQFFERNPAPSSQRTLRQALERIENCTALREAQSTAFGAWLQSSR
ncbi:MAG: M1 family peptidase [Acidobacteria bacterium]|nr:M1 family peptidase [Acidobacteriota bacterium]